MPFMNEAGFLLEEGVSIEDIDNACLNFGMPMGPCRLMDEVGHDVGLKVAKIIHQGVGDRLKSCDFLSFMVDKNFLGRKSNKGFYLYDENGKEAGLNEEVVSMLPSKKKKMDDVEIQMRIFLPMINEAAAILDEGIVQSATDVDLGLIFGIGFPPFRGGLLRYADSEGLERIHEALKRYQSDVDDARYKPTAFLEKLVSEKKKFYDLESEA
jgi:3-hydroxyacyl-CoA dehydrogenase/enoyl-CoA hydratase/3-hydroxybutyryl-CoA epimerase